MKKAGTIAVGTFGIIVAMYTWIVVLVGLLHVCMWWLDLIYPENATLYPVGYVLVYGYVVWFFSIFTIMLAVPWWLISTGNGWRWPFILWQHWMPGGRRERKVEA